MIATCWCTYVRIVIHKKVHRCLHAVDTSMLIIEGAMFFVYSGFCETFSVFYLSLALQR